MVKSIIFFLALIVSLNTANAKDFTGHYYLQGATEVGSELIIKSDRTFEWTLAYGVTNKYSEGKWVLQDKKLILSFDKSDRKIGAKLFGEAPDPISMYSPYDKLELVIKGDDLITHEMSGRYVKGKK